MGLFIDKLIFTGASLIDKNAKWIDSKNGRIIYDLLKKYDTALLSDSMSRVVLIQIDRIYVLFLIVKLGLPGTESSLNRLLQQYGDKSMAEDYLNSGSKELRSGGEAWAAARGYKIRSGPGSHRVRWGKF